MRSTFHFAFLVLAVFSATGTLRATDYTASAAGSWNTAGTWTPSGGPPTASDNAILTLTTGNLTVDTAAAASTVQFNNASGTATLIISDTKSLAVGGAITKPGAGTGNINVNNTTTGNAATVLTASSITASSLWLGLANNSASTYMAFGNNITLSVQLALPNNGNNGSGSSVFTQSGGTVNVGSNAGYGLAVGQGSGTANGAGVSTYNLNGGTLQAARIGAMNNDGNNSSVARYALNGVLNFNSGTIVNYSSGSTLNIQNGNANNGSTANTIQLDTSRPLNLVLGATGAHEFQANGAGSKIYISPSAQLTGTGTLTKTGAGDLIFTGGGSVATNTWSGNTTNTAGNIIVDYSQIAGMPATGGTDSLTNGYSPASQLVMNGGNFVFTGRSNAVAGSATGVTLTKASFLQTIASTAGLVVGQPVANSFLPPGTYIRRITSSTQIELSAYSTDGVNNQTSQTLTFGAANFTNSQTINSVDLLQAGTATTITVNPAAGTAPTLLTIGNITDSGGFTKAGTGTLLLNGGSSTYSGTTVVSAGTLLVGNALALGSTSGALTLGGGSLNLSGFAVTKGTLAVTGSGNTVLSSSAGGALSYATSLQVGAPSGVVGNLTINGAAITNVGNSLVQIGGFGYGASTLVVTNGGRLYSGNSSAGLVVNIGQQNSDCSVTVIGTNSVMALGGRQLSVGYTGSRNKLIIDGGTVTNVARVQVGWNGWGSTSNNIVLTNGGAYYGNAGAQIGDLGGAGGANYNFLTIGGTNPVTGVNSVFNFGQNTTGFHLLIGQTNATVAPYQTTNSAVNLNAGGSLVGAYVETVVPSSQLNLDGGTVAVQKIFGAGTNYLGAGGVTFDTGTPGGTVVSNAIVDAAGGSGPLVVAGPTTLILEGGNTYTAATTVKGTLLVNGATASGSTVTVISNAVLGGTGTIGGNVVFASGAMAGNNQGSPLTINGTLTLNNNTIYVSTPSVLGVGNYTLITYTAAGSSGSFNPTPVISGAGLAANTTGTIVTGAGVVTLHVALNIQPTAIAFSSSANPSTYGQSITFTAVVQTNNVTAANATSNVVFSVDGTPVVTNSVSGGQATYVTSLLAVPTHTITATFVGDANYLPSTNSLTQTVNQASLGITANNTNKVYDGVAFTGGNGVAYAGFVNSETPAMLGGTLSYAGTSQGATNAGSYTIIPSGLSSANYAISYTNGTLTINPASTFVGASSTKNPSGYTDSVSYTATLPADAIGSVVFSSPNGAFSTNAVSSGSASSLSIMNLPRGTNVITVAYLGDGNYLGSTNPLNQIVTNHPPVANAGSYSRGAVNNWHVLVSELLTNATDSIDGDPLTLVSVSVTTNGITLYNDGTFVGYQNTNLVTDQFTYTVTDGFGGTNSGTITLTATTTVTGISSIAGITGTNPKVLTAYGILNATYVTQRATNLDQEVWEDIATNHLGASGPFTVTDTNPPPGSAYYRLMYPVPQP